MKNYSSCISMRTCLEPFSVEFAWSSNTSGFLPMVHIYGLAAGVDVEVCDYLSVLALQDAPHFVSYDKHVRKNIDDEMQLLLSFFTVRLSTDLNHWKLKILQTAYLVFMAPICLFALLYRANERRTVNAM